MGGGGREGVVKRKKGKGKEKESDSERFLHFHPVISPPPCRLFIDQERELQRGSAIACVVKFRFNSVL